MKQMLFAVGFLILVCCGSSSGGSPSMSASTDAPTISKLSIDSPIKAGVASSGQLEVSDASGLSNLSLDFTVSNSMGETTMFSSSVATTANVTEAPLTFTFALGATTPPGTYSVSVSVTDNGEASNSLKTSVVVE
jgi:hypothetical protein